MNTSIQVLTNIDGICTYIQDEETKTKQLKLALEKAYHEAVTDPETYVVGIEDVYYGDANPKTIKELADEWNLRIHARLNHAIGQYLLTEPAQNYNKVLGNVQTYELVKAAMAANDEMHDYARELLFNMVSEHDPEDTNWVFKSVMRPYQLQHIMEHPEQYAVCNLIVK